MACSQVYGLHPHIRPKVAVPACRRAEHANASGTELFSRRSDGVALYLQCFEPHWYGRQVDSSRAIGSRSGRYRSRGGSRIQFSNSKPSDRS